MVTWQRKRWGKAPNTPSHWASRVQAKPSRLREGETWGEGKSARLQCLVPVSSSGGGGYDLKDSGGH